MSSNARRKESLAEMLREEGVDPARIRELFLTIHPIDLSTMLDGLRIREKVDVLNAIDAQQAARVIEMLEPSSRSAVVRRLAADRLAAILSHLPPDTATDLIQHTGKKKEETVLGLLPQEFRVQVESLLRFPPESVGAVMTTQVPRVGATATMAEAARVAKESQAESIENLFVVDDRGMLQGLISLKEVLASAPADPVTRHMKPVEYRIGPFENRQQAALLVQRHNLATLPVVGAGNSLLGMVTIRDVLGVVKEEAASQIGQMTGAPQMHPLEDPIRLHLARRMPYLTVQFVIEVFLAAVIALFFQDTVREAVLLSAFMPVIIATAGGFAVQASANAIRGLYERSIQPRDWVPLLWIEFRVGFLTSLVCGAAAGAIAYGVSGGGDALVVALSVMVGMIAALSFAGIFGTVVPIFASWLGKDPLVAHGPLVTSGNDLMGATIFLAIASVLQRIDR